MSNLNPGGLTRVLNYIKTWVTGLLNDKANSSHSHTKSQITDFPTIPSKTSQLTNDSGFLTAHQSLSNYVNRSSEQTISGNKTFNDRTRFKKGSYIHSFGSGQDVGYIKFATITIDAQYQDCTATLVIMNRSYLKPVCVHIKFYGVDHVDPNIDTFTTDATDRNANDYYLVKADTSTWDLYVYKTEWNLFTVLDFWQTQNNAAGITFTWKAEFVSSLPSGNIKATFSAYNYNDLSNRPTIPSKTSQLTNDSGYITSSGSCNYANSAGSAGSCSSISFSNNGQCYINAGGADCGDAIDSQACNIAIRSWWSIGFYDQCYRKYAISMNTRDGVVRAYTLRAENSSDKGLQLGSYHVYVG